jgi:hypothetical protein
MVEKETNNKTLRMMTTTRGTELLLYFWFGTKWDKWWRKQTLREDEWLWECFGANRIPESVVDYSTIKTEEDSQSILLWRERQPNIDSKQVKSYHRMKTYDVMWCDVMWCED